MISENFEKNRLISFGKTGGFFVVEKRNMQNVYGLCTKYVKEKQKKEAHPKSYPHFHKIACGKSSVLWGQEIAACGKICGNVDIQSKKRIRMGNALLYGCG